MRATPTLGIAVIGGAPWEEMARRARTVEEAGFDLVMTGDHLRHPTDPAFELLDGWSVLAGWAPVTNSVRLAMLVSNVIYRNPALLVKQAIAVDHISAGRLDLGIGSGVFDTDHAMAGVPPWSLDERIGRTDEFVQVVDRLLRGDTNDWRGRWYTVEQIAVAPLAVQQPRPPIVVGANHPRMLRVAARHADTWNTWGGYGIDEEQFVALTRQRNALVDQECEAADRDPASLRRSVLVHHGAFRPWESPDSFLRLVDTFAAMGFDECIFYWPDASDRAGFDRVVEEAVSTRSIAAPGAREVVAAYVERLLNQGDFDCAGDIVAVDCRIVEPDGERRGVDAVVTTLKTWRDAFPGVRFDADDVVVDGDRAAWTWRLRGRHASGRDVDISGVIVFDVHDGRIAAYRGYYDRASLAAQLA